jgi:hypothetical protein
MPSLTVQTKEALQRLDCPQRTFSKLVGVDEPALSRLLRGSDTLTPRMHQRISVALTFVVTLSENSKLPVCFHSYGKLEQVWNEFRKTLAA